MRTIKFRGQRIDNKEWIYGDCIQWKSKGKVAIVPQEGDQWRNPYDFEVIPETVGQFTGLLDRNGKEIYEGDILLFDNFGKNTCQVKECNGSFGYDSGPHWFHAFATHNHISIVDGCMTKSEIIGNIHSNPELLK